MTVYLNHRTGDEPNTHRVGLDFSVILGLTGPEILRVAQAERTIFFLLILAVGFIRVCPQIVTYLLNTMGN